MPRAYEFEAGQNPRYIDYQNGDDQASGTEPGSPGSTTPGIRKQPAPPRQMAAKWTPTFSKAASPIEAHWSGLPPERPKIPSASPAIRAGAMEPPPLQAPKRFPTGSGFPQQRAASFGFPENAADHLWVSKLPAGETPNAAWLLQPDGQRTRLPLARTPNWEYGEDYNFVGDWFRIEKVIKAFPFTKIHSKSLKNLPPETIQDARIWADHADSSGEFSIIGPFPSGIRKYNASEGSLEVRINHIRRLPVEGSPFFLENRPQFLDQPGEWYYDSGTERLYIWPLEDAQPGSTVEVARQRIILDLVDSEHVRISGLTFTGGNSITLDKAADKGDRTEPENFALMAAIRLSGTTRHIELSNLHFHHLGGSGVVNLITKANDPVESVLITDSKFEHIDNDGINLTRGFPSRPADAQPKGTLTEINIHRNRFDDLGMRTSIAQGGVGILLFGIEVADIAGNVITRTGAQGINVFGNHTRNGFTAAAPESPLVRVQIRNNRVDESLRNRSDFGGIEFWNMGPAYVYNNISSNPIGFVPTSGRFKKNEAFYFDHGWKTHAFNNIGWSKNHPDADGGVLGATFMKDVQARYNEAFHNTSHNFHQHYVHTGAAGDQQFYLGNVMIDAHSSFFGYWRLREAAGIGFSNNIFAGDYGLFYNRFRGDSFGSIEELQAVTSEAGNMTAKSIGWVTDDVPVRDADSRDYRLADSSAAIDRGVKVFVPWSLTAPVGEWHFRLMPAAPSTVLATDLFLQDFVFSQNDLHYGGAIPSNDLEGSTFTAKDYETGALEDWAPSALRFDGSKKLVLPNSRLAKPFEIDQSGKKVTIDGTRRKTVDMQNNNFLIETVLRIDATGQTATLASKLDESAGYALGLTAAGKPEFQLRTGGRSQTFTATTPLSADTWHHLIAEVDRTSGKVTFFSTASRSKPSPQAKPLQPTHHSPTLPTSRSA